MACDFCVVVCRYPRDRLYSAKRKMPEKERKVSDYGIWKSQAAALVLFAGLFGLVGCSGVPQEEFDRVSEDLNDTRAQEQQISNDLAVAQSKVKDIETELTDTETELADARAKLAEYSKIVETDYPDLSRRAEQARLILAVFNEFMNIGKTGDASGVFQLFGQLAGIDNPVIQQSVEVLLRGGASMSEDEAGLIAVDWLVEAEKLLSE